MAYREEVEEQEDEKQDGLKLGARFSLVRTKLLNLVSPAVRICSAQQII